MKMRPRFLWPGLIAAIAMIAVGWALGSWVMARSRGTALAEALGPLREELARRDVELWVVMAPYQRRASYLREDAFSERVGELRHALRRSGVYAGLAKGGVRAFNLEPDFVRIARAEENFIDGFHLSATGAVRFAEGLARTVQQELTPAGEERPRLMVMGECYAVDLAKGLRSQLSDRFRVDSLPAYGDAPRLVDLLFRFADDTLNGTRVVVFFLQENPAVWAAVERMTIPRQLELDATMIRVTARVTEDTGYDYRNWDSVRTRLQYPNALGELRLQVLDGRAGFPQDIVVMNYFARERQPAPLTSLHRGDILRIDLQPYDAYVNTNRAVASEYAFKLVDDLELPRYWLLDWTVAPVAP